MSLWDDALVSAAIAVVSGVFGAVVGAGSTWAVQRGNMMEMRRDIAAADQRLAATRREIEGVERRIEYIERHYAEKSDVLQGQEQIQHLMQRIGDDVRMLHTAIENHHQEFIEIYKLMPRATPPDPRHPCAPNPVRPAE